MKFFTAILSALALALALAVSMTSATSIDPRRRTSFPPNIMKRLTKRDVQVNPGDTVAILWDPSCYPFQADRLGVVYLGEGDRSDPGKLFSLPPPPRTPIASNSFLHPWLNWENLICVRPPHLVSVDVTNKGVPLSGGNAFVTIPMENPGDRDDYVLCGKSPLCGLGSIP